MPGVTRIYTYRFTPPGDALTLATAIYKAGEHVMKHNKHVLKVDTIADGEDMLIRMTVNGHDQWWIQKNVVYPVAGILTKVGIKVKEVKLDSVTKPPDPRGAKPHSATDPEEMIPHKTGTVAPVIKKNRPAWHQPRHPNYKPE